MPVPSSCWTSLHTYHCLALNRQTPACLAVSRFTLPFLPEPFSLGFVSPGYHEPGLTGCWVWFPDPATSPHHRPHCHHYCYLIYGPDLEFFSPTVCVIQIEREGGEGTLPTTAPHSPFFFPYLPVDLEEGTPAAVEILYLTPYRWIPHIPTVPYSATFLNLELLSWVEEEGTFLVSQVDPFSLFVLVWKVRVPEEKEPRVAIETQTGIDLPCRLVNWFQVEDAQLDTFLTLAPCLVFGEEGRRRADRLSFPTTYWAPHKQFRLLIPYIQLETTTAVMPVFQEFLVGF